MRADQRRVAYKQKLCLTCVSTTLAPLYVACQSETMTCPQCGIDTEMDMDPVYCTFIPKGLGKLSIEAPTCGPCAVILRAFAQKGGQLLEDRQPEGEGPVSGPSPMSTDYWAALGLTGAGRDAIAH
jgi:hypothetical protein